MIRPDVVSQAPLFPSPGLYTQRCDRCLDTGLWHEPNGNVAPCPLLQLGDVTHAKAGAAALALQRAVASLKFRKLAVNALAFDISRTLTFSSSATPADRDFLLDKYFQWTPNRLRKFQAVIEELRSVWLMPIGSRKSEPSGYWIITDAGDFKEWFERTKAAPITQLSWIHRVAKANFPVFAEQMEFDFWNDIAPAGPAAEAPPQ